MRTLLLLLFPALIVSSLSQEITELPLKLFARTASGTNEHTKAVARLRLAYNTHTADLDRYRRRVNKECASFPEGDLYSYALPAVAYANLAYRDPRRAADARRRMAPLLAQAARQTAAKVHAPGGDLLRLRDYRKHATYLGTLCFALGHYRMVGGDDPALLPIHDHLCRVLREAAGAAKGRPLDSYPTYSWNFDQIMVLAALDLADRIHGTRHAPLLTMRHLLWLRKHATDPRTGLPYAVGDREHGDVIPVPPRGCDIGMRVCLLGGFAPREAKRVYDAMVKHMWVEHGFVAGFAEWPPYVESQPADIDSGPIVMGMGLVSTGMGLGATQAAGDRARFQRLSGELAFRAPALALARSGEVHIPGARLADDCYTGFLFGDAVLFYALTWTAPPPKPLAKP